MFEGIPIPPSFIIGQIKLQVRIKTSQSRNLKVFRLSSLLSKNWLIPGCIVSQYADFFVILYTLFVFVLVVI